MIAARLIGGLGNQMFQYAAARRLSVVHRVPIELDLSGFRTYRLHRGFRLDHFSLPREVRLRNQGRFVTLLSRRATSLARIGLGVFGLSRQRIVREKNFHFDPQILALGEDVYLDGYWQSPKYFNEIEHVIRDEFKVRDPLAGKNLEFAMRMEDCLAVSLHVRRGDYVTDPHTNRYHGTCGPEYYSAAEAVLRNRLGSLHLFVFSDDPDWVEANLRFASPATVVRHNSPEGDYEDLRLMTFCKHHVIANSTFSWWGAWLCPNPDKVVVAPRNWFRDANHSAADLIPENWTRV